MRTFVIEVSHIPNVEKVVLRHLSLGGALRLRGTDPTQPDWPLRLIAECIVSPKLTFADLDALPLDAMPDVEAMVAALQTLNPERPPGPNA